MSWIDSLLGAIPIIGSAITGAVASNKASDAQADAANRATDLQREIYERDLELQKPFYQGGVAAENRMLELLGLGGNQGAAGYGSLNKPFSMADFEADPGYNFRFTEGLKALDRTASARGGLISGGALKAATRYGQDAASQEYQNAFNRYQVNRANILNPLQSLTGAGQSSANVMGAEGGTYATNAGNNMIGAGNARASGYVGGANAVAGGVGQYINNQNQMAFLKYLQDQNRGVSNIPAGWGGTAADPAYG